MIHEKSSDRQSPRIQRAIGYAGMRKSGNPEIQISGHAGMQMCGCGYADMQISGWSCSDMRVCGLPGEPGGTKGALMKNERTDSTG